MLSKRGRQNHSLLVSKLYTKYMSPFEMPSIRKKPVAQAGPTEERMPGLKITEPKPREGGVASDLLHDRTVYTTLDGKKTFEPKERLRRSLHAGISAGEALAQEQVWIDDATKQGKPDAENTALLERLVELGQEKFTLIEKWKGRVDQHNPEYRADMQRLAALISESVKLEMKKNLRADHLDA